MSAVVGGTLRSAFTLGSSGTLEAQCLALLLLMSVSFLCSAAHVAFTMHWRSFASCAVVRQCLHYFVCVGDGGICYVFVFEMDCVQMAFAFGGLDITHVCAIMFWGGEEIPPVN
jgi:hypothetical protein